MWLSRRAYAALRGVQESAVRRAIAPGRITLEADGTTDAARADAMWDASTDPAKQRGAHARDLGRGTAAVTRAVAGTKGVPRQAFAAEAWPHRISRTPYPKAIMGPCRHATRLSVWCSGSRRRWGATEAGNDQIGRCRIPVRFA